jgi:hypothetical protein
MDRDDVRVIERGDGARLASESGEALCIAGNVLGEDFDGNVPRQTGIVRAIDRAHSAGTERGADRVRAESGPWGEGHGGKRV